MYPKYTIYEYQNNWYLNKYLDPWEYKEAIEKYKKQDLGKPESIPLAWLNETLGSGYPSPHVLVARFAIKSDAEFCCDMFNKRDKNTENALRQILGYQTANTPNPTSTPNIAPEKPVGVTNAIINPAPKVEFDIDTPIFVEKR